MSSSPNPVSATTAPFVPTTTPTIERANRLISLRQHPGFLDALRLIQELVQEAADASADFPGWDTQQMVVLKVRHQAAKELKNAFLVKLNSAIQEGIDEAKSLTPTMPAKSAADALDQGDYVRQAVLQKFEESDNRPAGSY